MVQFDTIIFGRTLKNYFGQFVWIEKKVTLIIAFHFMKRRLKTVWPGTPISRTLTEAKMVDVYKAAFMMKTTNFMIPYLENFFLMFERRTDLCSPLLVSLSGDAQSIASSGNHVRRGTKLLSLLTFCGIISCSSSFARLFVLDMK